MTTPAIDNRIFDTHYGITWLVGISPIRQLNPEELNVVVGNAIRTKKEELWDVWKRSHPDTPVDEEKKKEELYLRSISGSSEKLLEVFEEDLQVLVLASRQDR